MKHRNLSMDSWIVKIEEYWDCFQTPREEFPRSSAVMIPLLTDKNGETAVLFEHRAKDLDVQPDEICFPGGGVEQGETPQEAVIRETKEELLIPEKQIRILGETNGIGSNGIMLIHAFVGVLENYAGTFSPLEVDHTFTVPLNWFLSHPPEEYITTLTTLPGEDFPFDRVPGGRHYPWRSQKNSVYFYDYPGEVIWGLTAKILYTFTQILSAMDIEIKD